ncbi:hypothetical protein GJ697_00845 [Pseudoduganella sp. FT25W]|jgi:hypothetical protein|uniref:Uncharacterized protein n=1 Tax=Duganella alba TaxID=2666081 RepID=A0A6L5Q9P5_9BURK|nr:hypothetical protein [Duganella alba]MRX06376.1 hypothetical protein [Duganella alba]MRX14770.1 hypothetical protein [Duganella alba]
MIVWRGYGILVLVFTVIGYALGKVGAEQIWGTPLAPNYRQGAELAGMLLAAAIVYGLHRLIEARQAPRAFVDKATGEEIIVKPRHDLFFIPLKIWPYILALLGVWFFFQK